MERAVWRTPKDVGAKAETVEAERAIAAKTFIVTNQFSLFHVKNTMMVNPPKG
jgi:hypothetical protein